MSKHEFGASVGQRSNWGNYMGCGTVIVGVLVLGGLWLAAKFAIGATKATKEHLAARGKSREVAS
jgi:hypothetical protein